MHLNSQFAILNSNDDWSIGRTKNVTFILTENCQLRCKYCYVVHKNSFSRMSFEIARETIEYLLGNRAIFDDDSVIWDFIGGEPLMEIDLLDQICDYLKRRMFELNHPWFNAYRLNLTTNGLMYDDERVQRFIVKNKYHLHLSITLDGTASKHDLNRIYPNGKGSHADVLRNIPLWLKQFRGISTKSTIAHADLPYIKESVLYLWSLGISFINMNVVFENAWEEGDDIIFEQQLRELADEIISQRLYIDNYCSLFSRDIGHPLDIEHFNGNWCGAGKMLAVDHKGDFFPCLRFAAYSLSNKKERVVGNCYTGIISNRLRPFISLDRLSQSTAECIHCEVASGCAWCQGGNYDNADTDTVYQRATYVCKMHKARVRANKYFWEKLDAKLKKNEE